MIKLERGLWPEGLVAAVAGLSVAWPLTTLLTEQTWIPLAVVMVALVALTGAALRTVVAPVSIVPLAQLAVGVIGLSWVYLPQTLWFGLPTMETGRGAAELLGEAGTVLRTYAAPAPTTAGVAFLVVAVLILTAVSVDTIGVTGGSPAVAGIPLAAAFLVSVSNSGQALQPWFFLATGGAWLLMMAQQGARLVDAWPSRDRREFAASDDVSQGRTGHRSAARVVGAIALVTAVAAAGVVPHLPPTYFAQGLARNPDANDLGDGSGQVSFVDTMDPAADLRNQSDAPVLSYTASARVLEPLKVTSTSSYEDDRWAPPDTDRGELTDPGNQQVEDLEDLDPAVEVTTQTVEVLENSLQPPHLAAPSPLTSLDTAGSPWLYDETAGAVVLEGTGVEQYTAGYDTFGGVEQLPEGVGQQPVPADGFAGDLQVPEDAQQSIADLNAEVLGDEQDPLTQATLIQNHLRSGEYLYSLELGPDQPDVPDEPISQFLANQQGYCVQFATAMVMMARDRGIPARMAVGFLPGTLQPGGSRTVIASDAHTWPELFLDGLGWTRFEPTPGIRTGPAPEFTQEGLDDVEATPTPLPTPEAVPEPLDPGEPQEESGMGQAVLDTLVRLAYVLAVLAGIGVLMLVIPLAGRWYRHRDLRRAQTPQDRVEAHWALLTRSLSDLGVPPPQPRSPRAMREHYRTTVALDPPGQQALGRVTQTLERARYAPAGTAVGAARTSGGTGSPDDDGPHQLDQDVESVLGAARETVSSGARLRARLLPRTGLTGLREWFRRR